VYVIGCRVWGGFISKRTSAVPLGSVSVHLTTHNNPPKLITHEFAVAICILSKINLDTFWMLLVLYAFPYPISGVIVSVLLSHSFIPMSAVSIPVITSPDPATTLISLVSNIALLLNVPVNTICAVSQFWIVLLKEHPAKIRLIINKLDSAIFFMEEYRR